MTDEPTVTISISLSALVEPPPKEEAIKEEAIDPPPPKEEAIEATKEEATKEEAIAPAWVDRPFLVGERVATEWLVKVGDVLDVHLPKELQQIVLPYALFLISEGMLIDARGVAATLNMFLPAYDRWDLCTVAKIINSNPPTVEVRAVDRVHPYPYLYPPPGHAYPYPYQLPENSGWGGGGEGGGGGGGGGGKSSFLHLRAQKVRTLSDLAPAFSQNTRNSVESSCEYDLLELLEEGGRPQVYEVSANIGSSLWILKVDNYESAEAKDLKRMWIDVNNKNLRPYVCGMRDRCTTRYRIGSVHRVADPANPIEQVEALVVDTIGYNVFFQPTHPNSNQHTFSLHLSDIRQV